MKFTWGTGITLTLIGFVMAMAFAVYKVMQEDFDLVTSDYYEQELIYQKKIDQKSNALALGEVVALKFSEEGLFIKMPSKLKGRLGDLHIQMYCVTDDELDFEFSKETWDVEDILIKHKNLQSGKWIAKITFSDGEKAYYFEPEIFLP
jgi:hypothetical protein